MDTCSLPKDGGICDVLPVPEHCDKERVVTVAPVCARHVSVCPDAGVFHKCYGIGNSSSEW